jgi:hypothetical protein
VIFEAVVVAYNRGLAERRKQALHTVSERNPEEVAVPIVVRTVVVGAVQAVQAVQAVHIEMEVAHMGVAVVRTEAAGVVQAVHMEVAVVRTEAAGAVQVVHTEVAVPNLAVAVGLDHKTWINPSRLIFIISHCTIQGNVQYHTTGVEANRQVRINVYQD